MLMHKILDCALENNTEEYGRAGDELNFTLTNQIDGSFAYIQG